MPDAKYSCAVFVSAAVGNRERIPRYMPVAMSAGARFDEVWNSIIRDDSIFFCIRLELSSVNFCAAVMRLLRSDSKPVSRGGRPNISRNELVMLPSGKAMEQIGR